MVLRRDMVFVLCGVRDCENPSHRMKRADNPQAANRIQDERRSLSQALASFGVSELAFEAYFALQRGELSRSRLLAIAALRLNRNIVESRGEPDDYAADQIAHHALSRLVGDPYAQGPANFGQLRCFYNYVQSGILP